MDETIEVVICHDILAVPYEDTTQYIWAGTQTFTIKHLENAESNNKGAELNSNNATVTSNDSNSNLKIESVTIQNENWSVKKTEAVVVNGDPNSVSLVLDNRLPKLDGNTHQNDNIQTSEVFICGICDTTFNSEKLMHLHRGEHFGYFNGSYKRPCIACNQTFSSVKHMSEHLYGHYPRTEKEKEEQANREKEMRAERKRIKAKKRQKKFLKDTGSNRTSPSGVNHENYPLTNNDRLSGSMLLSEALSRPRASTNSSVSSSPGQLNYKINNKTDKTNKYNSNHNKNLLIIQDIKSLAEDQPPQREWECGVCDVKFTLELQMHEHRLRHFGYFRTLEATKCAFCGENIRNYHLLSNHLLDHYMGRQAAVR